MCCGVSFHTHCHAYKRNSGGRGDPSLLQLTNPASAFRRTRALSMSLMISARGALRVECNSIGRRGRVQRDCDPTPSGQHHAGKESPLTTFELCIQHVPVHRLHGGQPHHSITALIIPHIDLPVHVHTSTSKDRQYPNTQTHTHTHTHTHTQGW